MVKKYLSLIIFLASSEKLNGVFNASAPNPVTNDEFTTELAKQLHRYKLLPAPEWLLKILLGEMSSLLLTGQRAIPQRALENGFYFKYPFTLQKLCFTILRNSK